MSSIYEQAYLTIMASSADSADISFLEHSSRPPRVQCRVAADIVLAARLPCKSGHHYIPVKSNVQSQERIFTRGWTLQEEVLSTRTISYSKDELQWRCKTIGSCECQTPAAVWREHYTNNRLMNWDKIVDEYTQRQLTFPADKLPALSGICQLVKSQTGSRYLAGLWQDRLVPNLLWECRTYFSSSRSWIGSDYVAPSFSWASIDYHVKPFDPSGFHEYARLVKSDILLSCDDPFGRVKRGSSITMEGKLFHNAGIRRGKYARKYHISFGDKDDLFSSDVDLETFSHTDSDGLLQRSVKRSTRDSSKEAAEIESGSTVSLFLLGQREHKYSWCFLVLGVSTFNRNAYERLGLWGTGMLGRDFFNGCITQSITIM